MSALDVSDPPKTARLNRLAVAALALALVAVSGLWMLGMPVLAVFAVGAGHVSLNQIAVAGERGRWLALCALGLGYGIGAFAVVASLASLPAVFHQLSS
ncbi:DUF4190 domain-containing protein [Paeniglutamicibacter cryotolerans]|uniref:DUF4190 domain-containing protein n=1 Tax=Paeniglutamicibacter cryotolerans TaxID=670079 RepID=A0A839QQQ2_9MICC|nr:DUF4190 domain-containing protein [Paeniglutamicibacter cryotolerans]MBB2997104.1 hypothetical protein [Paeniglutamicibacter cryotolerans]